MLVAGAIGTVMILAPAPLAANPQDVKAVSCLDDRHRPEVVQTAANLDKGPDKGEAVPGQPAMLCPALIKASSRDQDAGGEPDLWTSLLLLVAGGALTIVGGVVERTGQHRRQRLDRLAAAIDDFRGSAEDYLEAWKHAPGASYDTVAADRRKLVAALRALGAASSRRKAARALSRGVPLARPLAGVVPDEAGRGHRKDFAQRETEIAEQRTLMEDALATAELLARGSAVWYWRRSKTRAGGWLRGSRRRLRALRRGGRRDELPGGDGR